MKIEILASGSKGNCYKIESRNTALLIECGIPIREIREKLGFNLSGIDGVLVTHEHQDHAKAVPDLVRMGQLVYMTNGTKNAVAVKPSLVNIFKKTNIENRYDRVIIGDFIIQPFEVIHDAQEPVGFLIVDSISRESLVFITDTMYSKYTFKPNYMMLEVNYNKESINENLDNKHLRDRIKRNHMSLETAIEFLHACDLSVCKTIYVMHLSDSNSDENYIKTEIQKATGIPVVIC